MLGAIWHLLPIEDAFAFCHASIATVPHGVYAHES